MTLLVSFTGCTEKDTKSNNGSNNNNSSSIASQIIGRWQSEHIYINGDEHRLSMTIIMNADGTGAIGSSDNIRWSASGNNIQATTPDGYTFSFTVTSITATNMVITSNTIPGSDQQGAFEGHFVRSNGEAS